MALTIEGLRALNLNDAQIMQIFSDAYDQAAASTGTMLNPTSSAPQIIDPQGNVIHHKPTQPTPSNSGPTIVMPPAGQPVLHNDQGQDAATMLAVILEKLSTATTAPAVATPVVATPVPAVATPVVTTSPPAIATPAVAIQVPAVATTAPVQQSKRYTEVVEGFNGQLSEIRSMFEGMQKDREAEKSAQELEAYRRQLISSVNEAIIPEMVVGSTKEQLNISFISAQKKWHELVKQATETAADVLGGAVEHVIPTVGATAAQIIAGTPTAVDTGIVPAQMSLTPDNIGQIADSARNGGSYEAVRDILLKAGKSISDNAGRSVGPKPIVTSVEQVPANYATITNATKVPPSVDDPLTNLSTTQLFERHAQSMMKKGKLPPNRILSLDPGQHPQLQADNVKQLTLVGSEVVMPNELNQTG